MIEPADARMLVAELMAFIPLLPEVMESPFDIVTMISPDPEFVAATPYGATLLPDVGLADVKA
jgi:hypothetical protein